MSPHFFLMPVGGVLAVLILGYLWMVTLSFYMMLQERNNGGMGGDKEHQRSRGASRYPGPIYEVN